MKHAKTAGPRDEGRRRSLFGYEYASDERLLAEGWTLIDDTSTWMPVLREIERWERACDVDASDETRLDAGWSQQVCQRLDMRAGMAGNPAPGVAGLWRLHASGVWVRWVLA